MRAGDTHAPGLYLLRMVNMSKLPVVLVILAAAACGGSRPASSPAPTPVAPNEPIPQEPTPVQVGEAPKIPPATPAADTRAAAAFTATCSGIARDAQALVPTILDVKDKRSVENTLEPFNRLMTFVYNAGGMAGLAREVHPDKGVREAAQACERDVQKFVSELLLDRRMFDALSAVDVKKADPNTRRFVTIALRDYKRAGVALDDAKRTRIKVIDDEMTTLGQQHSENIAGDTRYLEVKDASKLAGLPADWIAAHKPDASGTIRISTDYPDYVPFSTYATDDDLRKQLYIKFRSRGDAHNEEVLQKLLVLRAEKAKLLGFKDWADYQSDDKMLKGGKAAAAFLERVTGLANKRAARDYAELLAQLKKTDPKATSVGDWQKAFLEDQLKKSVYAVDSAEVRTYFPYDKVLAGLLEITSAIYDVQYQPVQAAVWHPSVKVFDVMRKGDKLGRIFLDMHPRDNKYKHAAQFPMLSGVTGMQLPEGALVCNFPETKAGDPGLMEHGDVVTMFHEFGHLMHHVLGGQQKWVSQSGVATEQDFVEAPSQMFEEWGWSYETLSRFAKHHETGAVIPKPLVDKMQKSRTFGVGTWAAQQMFYAAIALRFHQVDPTKIDQLGLVKQLQAKYTPFAYVEGTKFHTSFGHLVGYSSMYYTYMWSLVIAKDLLTPFEKPGLLATAVTQRYRDKILAAGGTKDAADLVKDFLGRSYNFKAFEKYLSK
ncbi:MAG: Thimet oligopeptidase [Myxococcales bacterium]|nr:Thimet oligopeptidase [Myxococcales bacterium]